MTEEINQLRIENMRLKKKGGDGDMTNKRFIFVDNIFKYLETGIKDNKSDYDSLNGESVVDLLNELVEENEQLKKARDKSDKFIVKKGLEIEFLEWCIK